ncbi:MAG TPA: alanine racemase [Ruminiclostridium sp.]|nr:alanine racemase [Ruminiclostridium sp.]
MTTLVVEKQFIADNYNAMRSETGVCVIPVLKGNAYGMGEAETARILWDAGARLFAASRLEEALVLKAELPEAEILLLTPYGSEEDVEKIVSNGITAALGSYESGVLLNGIAEKHNVKCRVHIKFDTGMGRFGFLPQDAEKAAQAAKYLTSLTVVGSFTHLSNCFGKSRKDVMQQLALFKSCLNTLEKAGVNPGLSHIANTNGALLYPELRLDAVRCGSALIGRPGVKTKLKFQKVGHLQSNICDMRWIPAGHNIGYANTYKTKKPTHIAVVPVGYSQGLFTRKIDDTYRFRDFLRCSFHDFMRLFGEGRIYANVYGKKARVVGRVGMCNIVLDVTDIECNAGDLVSFDANPLLINADVERKYI